MIAPLLALLADPDKVAGKAVHDDRLARRVLACASCIDWPTAAATWPALWHRGKLLVQSPIVFNAALTSASSGGNFRSLEDRSRRAWSRPDEHDLGTASKFAPTSLRGLSAIYGSGPGHVLDALAFGAPRHADAATTATCAVSALR
jgi:hypothetical protein